MPTWIYRPKHPLSNANGMVDRSLVNDDPDQLGLYVISDEMPATRHMATGEHFTSKAKFRARTKEMGCVEFGNEVAALTKPRERIPLSREKRRDDIRRTIYELRNGIRRD